MAQDAEVLLVELHAKMAQFDRQLKQTANMTDAQLARIEKKYTGTQKALNRGLQFNSGALDRGLQNARRNLDSFAGRAPVVGGLLDGMGTKATVAAAGVAALGAALLVAGQAMGFADEIADSAAQAQVGVEALQAYRYAALAAGAEIRDADEALKGLSTTMGRAIAGEAKALRWFKAIGLGPEELKSLGTAEALLPRIADEIANLSTEAQKAALAEKLGVRPLLPLLEQGSAGIAKLTEEARRLGVVMDRETVKSLGDAHDKVQALSLATKVNLYTALADLAPVLVWITGLVAGLSRSIREAVDLFRSLENKAGSTIRSQISNIDANIARVKADGRLEPSERTAVANWQRRRAQLAAELKRREAAAPPPPTPGSNTVSVAKPGGGAKPKRDREAEEKAERERLRRVAEDLYRAKLAQLEAEAGLFRDLEERQAFEQDRLAMEQAHERELLAQREDLTAEERAQLELAMERRQAAEERNLLDRQAIERAEAEKAELEAIADLNAQILRLASERATSWQERRALERQMLDIAQEQRRADLALLLETGKLTQAQYEKRLALIELLENAEDGALADATAGPLERARKEFDFTRDELEELAVTGVRGLGNAAVDVLMQTKSSAQAIKELWASLLRDILNMLAEQYINKPATNLAGQIFSAIFSGGAGGSIGRGGGFAMGGRPPVGQAVDVGEFGREKFVADVPGQIVPNNAVRMIESLNPGSLGGVFAPVSLKYAPVIDARGADASAIGQLKAMMEQQSADFERRAIATIAEALDRRQIRTRPR